LVQQRESEKQIESTCTRTIVIQLHNPADCRGGSRISSYAKKS
jgi:hypothetical protein